MENNKFRIKLLDGFVDINTLSPNKKYYYRITKPSESTMGLASSGVLFYKVDGKKCIFKSNGYNIRVLESNDTFQNVYWLNEGNYAAFVIYRRQKSEICLLDLENEVLFTFSESKNCKVFEDYFDDLIKGEFDFQYMERNFNRIDLKGMKWKRGFFEKWYPSV
jgi:hypothetical protein